ncbi:MAG TPA: universal stress protein [Pseudonocardia sp.]|nr:universal stress protein [Pseudonocardia sp.]
MAGRLPGRRLRGDPKPTAPVGVVLATEGCALSPAAVEQAARLAGGAPVAVVSIARIHGSALGLPNPGLLPSRKEREEQRDIVAGAIEALEHLGVRSDGEVVVTRNAGRAFARVATLRGASHVVLETRALGRIRRLLEGDPASTVRRRLPGVNLVRIRAGTPAGGP